MSNFSKQKGTAYETKIKNILTKELGLNFQRVPLSGSLSYLKGDLWVPDNYEAWPYVCEMKHYAEIEWNNLLTAQSTDIHTFWKQAKREAETMKKKPLLIFRWNRSQDFAAWNDDLHLDNQLHIKAFGEEFKIGLLNEWIIKYKAR